MNKETEKAIRLLEEAQTFILKADALIGAYCNWFDYGPDPVVQTTKLREVVQWTHSESERLKEDVEVLP